MRTLISLAVLGFSCLVSSVFAQSPASTSPVVTDILKLSRAKVDEGVVLAYVQNAPRGNVSAADLLTLHSNGISSRVLVALLDPRPTADRGETEAPAEAPPPVSEPAAQNAEATAQETSAISSVAVVETPVVDYVSAPVYVGGGSIYYGAAWCGSGWGWGWGLGWGWGWGYPWYGYGCYPYRSGYYAHYGSHHHHHGHGHHGHSGGHHHNGGGLHVSGGGSTIAGSAGNRNSGLTASPASRSISGGATARLPLPGSRADTGTAARNFSSRNAGNASAGVGRVATSPGGNMAPRSSTSAANGRSTAPGMPQNGGARPTVTPSGGANRPVTVPGTGQRSSTIAGRNVAPPTRSAPASPRPVGTVTAAHAGSPNRHSGYQGGGQTAAGSPGPSVGHSSGRSVSAPVSMGNYSAGRSSAGGSFRGGYSGGGGSRGFSGGGGGSRGGGFGGGGHGGGGGRR